MDMKGIRVSARYSKTLAGFAAWVAFGAAAGLFVTQQAILGGVLLVIGFVALALVVEGSRITERVYTKLDLALQFIMLGLPTAFVLLAMIVLSGSLLRPFVGYIAAYFLVQLVLTSLAIYELRRGERVG